MKPSAAYGAMDRALHHLAFASTEAQLALADVETGLYKKTLDRIEIREPVFITSLPRAGTTLLLEVLSVLPDFAGHTYRVMPFVLCPLVWDRISRPFRRTAKAAERAHGDGVVIGFDSPEAFEEVVWLKFWQSHYHDDRIDVWEADDIDEEFEAFLRDHMRKIIALGAVSGGDIPERRYLSKNNANIARLDTLTAMFPDCHILIPIRDPWDHAASMQRQHERFAQIHRTDGFARRYMEWLGHYEFGAAHRPMDFNGWRSRYAGHSAFDPAYWLTYWGECYTRVLEADPRRLVFIDYDRLCAAPNRSLAALGEALGIRHVKRLLAEARKIHPPTRHGEIPTDLDRRLLRRTEEIHAELKTRAL